ncbi:hypothetical protein ACFYUY_23215 [Kitasatospora sp. NPDC004745]|uniref:hypothetical protein n=1 Tax=Kitasatospora sp. NPDC004745 TaxID=3364019 RepID=UPI0036971971
MTAAPRPFARGWLLASCIPALLVLGVVATAPPASPDPRPSGPATASPTDPGLSQALGQALGQGLAAEQDGYRLDTGTTELPAGRPNAFRFRVIGPNGAPVTAFTAHQARTLHFYAIRTDLTGYQHLHPEMAPDGTWTAELADLASGTWRLYASFVPADARRGQELVLSRTVTVPGRAAAVTLPAPASSATVDGYTVALRAEPMAGAHQLTATVTRDGSPVTDLQPYLDSYAHLSAFHQGDQSLAHLHPTGTVDGDHGGPTLTFLALLGEPGDWRVFLQFQTDGRVHTAELTLHVD